MKPFRFANRPLFARTFFSVVVTGMAVLLASYTSSVDASSATKKLTKPGVILQSDDFVLEVATGVTLMPGYSRNPINIRLMGGWVNTAKAKSANTETDQQEKQKQLMGSFGLLTIHIAAGMAEPGTYQLGADVDGSQRGTIIIDQVEEVGMSGDYTSKSGTLTVKSVTMNDKKLLTIEGEFEGEFSSSSGDTRTFSGQFLYSPK